MTEPVPDVIKNSHRFSPEFKLFVVIASLFSLSRVSYMFFIVHVQKELATPSPVLTSMLLYVLFYVFYSICSIPIGILSDHVGRWIMTTIGYILFAITLFGFMVASTIASFIICFILYGIALAIVQVTHKAYASDLSPAAIKATALGAFESITGITMFATGLIAGILWDKTTHHTVFMCAGILAASAAGLLIVFKKRLVKAPKENLNLFGDLQ